MLAIACDILQRLTCDTFQVTNFSFVNRCSADVILKDWNVVVPTNTSQQAGSDNGYRKRHGERAMTL